MNFTVVGLNHKTAPVELRERLAFAASEAPAVLDALCREADADEAVLLSTCNRVEVYARGREAAPEPDRIAKALAGLRELPPEDFMPHLYSYTSKDAVRHLCSVACGMDSMVLGETQILGQVREAYLTAASHGKVGGFFNNLFQAVFHLAGRVHTETGISREKVSVGSVAVDLAKSIFDDFAGKSVLVIGAGDMGKLTLSHLAEKGLGAVIVANRTYEQAVELAARYGGRAVRFDEIIENLKQADIVIGSSAAPHVLIRQEQVREVMKDRPGRPIFLIDIAVPRDIDPEVAKIDNVHLYDIDDLRKVVDANAGARRRELAKCIEMVDENVDRFVERWGGRQRRRNSRPEQRKK